MHALNKLQRLFAADIWDDDLNRLDGVIQHGRLPAQRLFQIYRNNFWIATEEALTGIYGVIKRLVGDPFFAMLVNHFLRSYPPRFGNMLQLGRDFPVFLSDFVPIEELPYLTDVARLEWAFHRVFHAADAMPLDNRSLAEISPDRLPRLNFELSPSSRIVHSPFPVFEIWRVNQPDHDGDQSVDLDRGGESVLLARPGLAVELQKLERGDARFLQSLVSGNNLETATQAALNCAPGFDLEQALARYLLTGTLVLADNKQTGRVPAKVYPGGKRP